MNDPATSLDRLHDLVEPPPVPYWPPAPGWYFVIAVAAVVVAWLSLRYWKQWQKNAYRREALRKLKIANTPAEIAELLRRTALMVAPRSTVASLSGNNWAGWLDSSVSESMPRSVHSQLVTGIYEPECEDTELDLMREYARTWIERHDSSAASRRESKK